MRNSITLLGLASIFAIVAAPCHAQIYLNDDAGVTVEVGPNSSGAFVNVSVAQSLANIINLDADTDAEVHTQSSHIWWNPGPLELLFDLGEEYRLSALHLWNYTGETYDVDTIDIDLRDASGTLVGNVNLEPALGTSGTGGNGVTGILAQDIALSLQLRVRYLTVTVAGSNGQVDFNNMGFTAIPCYASEDSDGDGVPDAGDNCVFRANPAQRDTDGDGYGNYCDGDFNNDNLTNPVDLGLFKASFFQAGDLDADLNGDGIVNPLDLGIFKGLYFDIPGPSCSAPLSVPGRASSAGQ